MTPAIGALPQRKKKMGMIKQTEIKEVDTAIFAQPFIVRLNFRITNPPPTIPIPAAYIGFHEKFPYKISLKIYFIKILYKNILTLAGNKIPPQMIAEIEASIEN